MFRVVPEHHTQTQVDLSQDGGQQERKSLSDFRWNRFPTSRLVWCNVGPSDRTDGRQTLDSPSWSRDVDLRDSRHPTTGPPPLETKIPFDSTLRWRNDLLSPRKSTSTKQFCLGRVSLEYLKKNSLEEYNVGI